ncbi:MAG: thioredoxin domain-containing protein [Aeromicrobium sp.]|uniref:thioredoxin domain-containing protein n=1 Tax=Aeromicrobium sp. TaxID=1871063 RepID=UPI0026240FE4|nr:thioredoxin domain-containing protein [Aeromicrobium sp.]MDF1703826.1 thioredoxin domain-containing protein [Aeromicrobium sp.]
MVNRLAAAQSPYLQQHAGNPVGWWEWGEEAFAVARELDRPVLLSVGYAACHWCHVMAHESFEDPATADFMNAHFVNIKVDREERPDVDAVYMRATQAMTGQGGWPMTCVLTPEGEPFFAGTYFPPEATAGSPAFTQVLQALAEAWRERRDEVLTVGRDVVAHLRDARDPVGDLLTTDDLDEAAATLAGTYDDEAAGFGTAPKFPPSMVLEFLLRHHDRTGSPESLEMVEATCTAMARGGLYDQLAGGFARYSVDRHWRVPHFEKMLYDNALLLRVYLHWWRATGSVLAERVARETAAFLLRELRTDEGGFASALDADSADGRGEVHEGTYYVWTPNDLMRLLGAKDGAWAVGLLGVTGPGTFERGFSTMQLREDPDDPERWDRVRAALLEARDRRARPARDDKVVASWNGWTITALVEAGVLLKDPALTAAAVEAAELLVRVHLAGGRLVRTSRDGVASRNAGVLEDHAAVAEAFLAVLGVTGDAVWLGRALALLERVVSDFADPEGGFVDAPGDGLVLAPRDVADNAYPSGVSAAAGALLAAAAVTGDARWRSAAERAVESAAPTAHAAPRFGGQTLSVAEAMHAGPVEVAVVGAAGEREEMLRAAWSLTSPGAVVVGGEPGLEIPLFTSRTVRDGLPTAYVCRGFVCQAPVTDPDALPTLT